MMLKDVLNYAWIALRRFPLRTSLIVIAVAIGVVAVVVLSSLGEAARRYVTNEFKSIGSNLLIVLPGRTETVGANPAVLVGETPRDLTIADAMALLRSPLIARVAPLALGSALVSRHSLSREAPIIGTTAAMYHIRRWQMQAGRFLSEMDPHQVVNQCVLGHNVAEALFGHQSAVGQWVRIGQWRFQVVGVLASSGQSQGMNTDDLAIIPVAAAQSLFNSYSLFRIFVEGRSETATEAIKQFIRIEISKRHQNEEDITVISQDAVLSTFNRIFRTFTLTLAAIASISLLVAGILIMNVMLVTVAQRMEEIGLLKALGATRTRILHLFISEAFILCAGGVVIGLILGVIVVMFIGMLYPSFPVTVPPWSMLSAGSIALIAGLLFSYLPARRASRLQAVVALNKR